MLKISRIFAGGYTPNQNKLAEMKCIQVPDKWQRIISVLSADQGFGQIKGTVKKLGATYPLVSVCVFKRSSRQLLWEAKSKHDGSYALRNIAAGLECFIVAFDPAGQYNAVIQDKVVAK
jgi:hypothetical protein